MLQYYWKLRVYPIWCLCFFGNRISLSLSLWVCVCVYVLCVCVCMCVDNSRVPGRGGNNGVLENWQQTALILMGSGGTLSTIGLLPHAIGIYSRENSLRLQTELLYRVCTWQYCKRYEVATAFSRNTAPLCVRLRLYNIMWWPALITAGERVSLVQIQTSVVQTALLYRTVKHQTDGLAKIKKWCIYFSAQIDM
jgi:hypothetical protein